jgi:hypothetical protein
MTGEFMVLRRFVLAIAFFALLPALAAAQSRQAPRDPAPIMEEESLPPVRGRRAPRTLPPQPELDDSETLAPSQMRQTPPQAQPARPARARPAAAAPVSAEPAPVRSAEPSAPRPASTPRAATGTAAPGRALACGGVFGRDSSHLKLAMAFDSKNVVFTEVDGPEGSKLPASVVFPGDPKRRLEVLWQNEAGRSDTALIVINGQSGWAAPKGLRLGLALAALEKINGKPFQIAGFDQGNAGTVIDWQGGALASLPGGCSVGIRLAPDAKAPESARGAAAGKSLLSNEASVRALKPAVAEIILGYSH